MNCTSCGFSLSPDTRFCEACGAAQAAQPTSSILDGGSQSSFSGLDSNANNSFGNNNGFNDSNNGFNNQNNNNGFNNNQNGFGGGSNNNVPPANPFNQQNNNVGGGQQAGRQRADLPLILATISIVLVAISWFVPLVVDLFLSIPAILLAVVAVILSRRNMKKNNQGGANMPQNRSFMTSLSALGGAVISTIIFIILIALV